ncbi:MAG: signal peptidase II [Candidatus Nanoarchaeia archaeon]|nr:signal peptidase II [Candidatus Nanoarchaeia archaeon]
MANKLIFTGFLVVLLDQITKFWMENYHSVTHNYGAAFGLFQGGRILFILVGILVLYLIYKWRNSYNNFALGLLLGGVIGNLIDRVVRVYVVDFIDLGFWPSFNVADSAATVGVILLIYYHWKD